MSRIARLIHRGRNHDYRSYLFADLEARLLLKGQLAALARYHEGKQQDFSATRDRYLSRIVQHARSRSRSYATRLEALPKGQVSPSSNAWLNVPLLSKADIRREGEELMTMPPGRSWIGHLTTGGSTGQPLGFPYLGGHDAEHQEFLWRMMGYTNGDRILAMDGTLVPDEDLRARRYWTSKSPRSLPYGTVALSAHYWSNDTRDDYVNFLLEYQPALIRGYPSFVSEVAQTLLDRGLRLGCKGVQLTSESHTSHQTYLVESAMGPVRDQYGHAEASIFAYSLESFGPIFCSPFYGLVEILSEDGYPVAVGEPGEVVVTGFHNYAMPFIRYRTGDLAVLQGVEDGVVRLREIQGRTQDYVISSDGTKHLLTALVFGRHYAAFERISQWQIIQRKRGAVVIRIVPRPSFSSEDAREIVATFKELAGIAVDIEITNDIARTARGKSKLLVQTAI